MGEGMTVLMNDVISSRTRVVGPVWPLSDGFETERPHPLDYVRLYANRKCCDASVVWFLPLIKSINFDSLRRQGWEKVVVCITCSRVSELCRYVGSAQVYHLQ